MADNETTAKRRSILQRALALLSGDEVARPESSANVNTDKLLSEVDKAEQETTEKEQ